MVRFNVLIRSMLLTMLILGMTSGTASAAADIAINNAKFISPDSVLVTFNNPGQNINDGNASKWHIDINFNGNNPLNATGFSVTNAGDPWQITLTFEGSNFPSDMSRVASDGLYVDDGGVNDTNLDTNQVITHDNSIPIGDGQPPTFTAART